MKLRLIFASGLLVAVLISCQCLRDQSTTTGRRPVQIDKHSVLIPGTAISADDQAAINRIFRNYDSSLYRIAVYEHGSSEKLIGTMDEIEIKDIAKDYAGNAVASGLSNWTYQIGFRTHVTRNPPSTHVTRPGDTTHVTTPGNPTHVTHLGKRTHVTTLEDQADALVQEVTPILEKYSK